ncbi:MAG: DUF3810 family protein, partial [Bacteroidota bacterium]
CYVGPGHIKMIHGNGWMRKMGASGIYLPWSGLGHVDASYTRHQILFIAAHELSHAHSITDEGEANLIAYLALSRSQNPELRFVAEFTLLRYLLTKENRSTLPLEAQGWLDIIKENRDKYSSSISKVGMSMNNLYLKTMGVKSGINSYGSLPNLVYAFENRTDSDTE